MLNFFFQSACRCLEGKTLLDIKVPPQPNHFENLTGFFGAGDDRTAYLTFCAFANETGDNFQVVLFHDLQSYFRTGDDALCKDAQPILTDAGVCWAINSGSMSQMYRTAGNEVMDKFIESLEGDANEKVEVQKRKKTYNIINYTVNMI